MRKAGMHKEYTLSVENDVFRLGTQESCLELHHTYEIDSCGISGSSEGGGVSERLGHRVSGPFLTALSSMLGRTLWVSNRFSRDLAGSMEGFGVAGEGRKDQSYRLSLLLFSSPPPPLLLLT